jgi:putative cell wall-binding protein
MFRALTLALTFALVLALPGSAGAHEKFDHDAPAFTGDAPLSSAFNSGGEGAEWELVTTIPTGNPHTDLDFFTQGGETFASVGTLGTGPNGGGQTIVQLTEEGEVAPSFVSAHPSAECPSSPRSVLGLQHDVEATPKGDAILNTANPLAVRTDAQLLLDASDAEGRCHDGGVFGVEAAPQGGLEIVDITDIENPEEIGLVSHIGEAHTVNVDPKRPHIAFAVTSDSVGLTEDGQRTNENPNTDEGGEPLDLDGFEVVDLSTCMNFPEGTSVEDKREACRPEVFRFRYPTAEIARGHTLQSGANGLFGCHETEIYPNDLLACGGGNAAILFDFSGAFDDNGTPEDFTDDKPRGTPLPCRLRDSTSESEFQTGAVITDCVNGGTDEEPVDLTVPGWLAIGAPSLEGVEHVGSAHHMGRGAGTSRTDVTTTFDATEDVDFNHETELTPSGRFLIATDERGGGVVPPGASCSPGADNEFGNGGLHAYAVDRLDTELPETAEEAWDAYARTPDGEKAIYRARIRTQPEGSFCTAHVFQQIPGQNRIFMGWYSQGTQVVDFVEHPDGTLEFREAGFFIPENANTWVSHVFKVDENEDGTFTYYGATGDFNFGTAGRNAIDIYKVTLPAPPEPLVLPEPEPVPAPAADEVRRVAGEDAVATGVALSADAFESAETAVIARADVFADALAASALAAEVDGPVLLTEQDRLDEAVGDELERLGVREVYLLGGEAALSAEVERDLRERDLDVTRLSGPTRFETAVAIADEVTTLSGPVDQAIVALGARPSGGDAFPDALAAGNLAATGRAPILLTLPDQLPSATAEALHDLLDVNARVFITGGTAAVSAAVERELRGDGFDVARLSGPSRYDTAVAVVEEARRQGADVDPTVLASGDVFTDALVAGPVAHRRGGVMLLVAPESLEDSPATGSFLEANAAEIDDVVVAGTDISDDVVAEVQARIRDAE